MKQVIFFKGSTCVPCKVVEPYVDEVMEEVKANVRGSEVQYVKAVDDVAWMANFGIRQVPAVVIINEEGTPTVLLAKEITKEKIDSLLN